MAGAPRNLRAFLELLGREGELATVRAEVDPDLELAEIHRRVIASGGPALCFERVRGSPWPVVTNLFGTRRRVELAFGPRPRDLVQRAAQLPEQLLPPSLGRLWRERRLLLDLARLGTRAARSAPVTELVEAPPRLTRLPAIKTWPRDGGRFLTLPLVLTRRPGGATTNLGLYRMQVFDDASTGMHFQIGKGGGFHLAEAEARGVALPAVVHLGGPPAAILAAIAPLPENVPELVLASLALGEKLAVTVHELSPLPIVAEAEFALLGEVQAGVRRPEGPFGDHYGYYSETHDYPVFTCRALCSRRNAVLPATVVGKPRQEDFFLGDFLQELLAPLFPLVMPGVRDLWSYGETGYHSLAAAVVRERYKREAMASAFRILGEGQLALTKFLLVLDGGVELRDFRAVLQHVLARADLRTDLFVFANLAMDSLDYAGPRVNEGSKGCLLGLGEPIRRLPAELARGPAAPVRRARVFCPGCLVVDGPSHAADPGAAALVARDPALAEWPLVVLSDDAERAARSTANFLWTTFTRFDPARDLHAARVELVHHHAAMTPPLVLDARLKAGYPAELACDPETALRVGHRWNEYFPAGAGPRGRVEMGDSERAHLD
jgi:UbiD family decarboxylase